MSEGQYELVMNPEYDDFNLELLKDYWESVDIEKQQFTYTAKVLWQKYDIKSTAKLERIVKHSGHLKYTGLKDCKKCYFDYEIYIRKDMDFKRWNSYKKKLVCHECRRVSVQSYMNKYLNEFKLCIPIASDAPYNPPTQQLSYLEKIVLYTMISKIKIGSDNILPKHEWHSFIELEANGTGDLVKKIFEKGYLFKTDEFDEFIQEQANLRQLHSDYKQYFNEDMVHEIQTYLALNFRTDINLVIPECYDSLEQWTLGLFQEIVESKIYVQDIKDIEKYIKNKRLKEIYELVGFICDYRKVPYEKDSALEFELMRMLNSFNLRYIFSILAYQAKEASAELYKIEHQGDSNYKFRKNHVFRYKLASYLTHLLQKKQNPKFDRDLPIDWTYSELENFISAQIIGNYEHWEVYTPDEILALWVESVGMQNDEENI